MSPSRQAAFWSLSVFGVLVMIAAWVWFGMAHEEEMSDQSKALSAGTTMAGFGAWVGGAPLVVAHAVGLATLSTVAIRGRCNWTGVVYAVGAVALASGIGVVVARVLYQGQLFQMGLGARGLVPVD